MKLMRKIFCFSSIFMLVTLIFSANCATIKMTCRSKGMELELCKKAVDEWRKKNKHKVEIVTLPHASNECFALYQQWFGAETLDIDIFQMDVAWIGVFSDYLVPIDSIDINLNDYFAAIKENMFCNGKMIALPWYTDCGVMYYRKDLLEKYGRQVPKTWQELYETAKYIQSEERKEEGKQSKFYGLVLQAKAFEILTCNFVEFIDSFGGAVITDGNISINSTNCLDATLFLVKCLRNITSRSVLNYSEEDARGMFQSGNAVFMRNWPYAWSLLNEKSTAVAGKIGVMPIPPSEKNGKSSGVLGGWFLTVSRYSKNADVAADLVRFLTSKHQQKMRSRYSYLPAFKSLYSNKEVLENNPFFGNLYHSLENAVARPSIAFGKNYTRASTEIFNTVNTILAESVESRCDDRYVKKSLDRLAKRLKKILQKKAKESDYALSKRNRRRDGIFTKLKNAFSGFFSRIKSFLGMKSNA